MTSDPTDTHSQPPVPLDTTELDLGGDIFKGWKSGRQRQV